jgi:hypothetical protein
MTDALIAGRAANLGCAAARRFGGDKGVIGVISRRRLQARAHEARLRGERRSALAASQRRLRVESKREHHGQPRRQDPRQSRCTYAHRELRSQTRLTICRAGWPPSMVRPTSADERPARSALAYGVPRAVCARATGGAPSVTVFPSHHAHRPQEHRSAVFFCSSLKDA